jgi:hypothetical protein
MLILQAFEPLPQPARAEETPYLDTTVAALRDLLEGDDQAVIITRHALLRYTLAKAGLGERLCPRRDYDADPIAFVPALFPVGTIVVGDETVYSRPKASEVADQRDWSLRRAIRTEEQIVADRLLPGAMSFQLQAFVDSTPRAVFTLYRKERGYADDQNYMARYCGTSTERGYLILRAPPPVRSGHFIRYTAPVGQLTALPDRVLNGDERRLPVLASDRKHGCFKVLIRREIGYMYYDERHMSAVNNAGSAFASVCHTVLNVTRPDGPR